MPIIDKNGDLIVFHATLEPNITTIEFGAGKSCFGKKEFPLCYTTDLTMPEVLHFSEYPTDYETQDCHFLDQVCDYTNLNFTRSFDHLILCNPYGLGFNGRTNTKQFLDIASSILNPLGRITILGNSTNPWSKYVNFDKNYRKLVKDNEIEDIFSYDRISIDDNHSYRSNHSFYLTNFQSQTYPNEVLQIAKKAV